jgi:hypothetical protein
MFISNEGPGLVTCKCEKGLAMARGLPMMLKILVIAVYKCNRSRPSNGYDRIFLTSLLTMEYKFLVKAIRFKAIIWFYLFYV